MGNAPDRNATELVKRLQEGDRSAEEPLLKELYSELHRIAEALMRRERAGHTLQPTVLVSDAYVKIFGPSQPEWQSRSHVLAVAARAMRQVLRDHARDRKAQKRGGDAIRVTLHEHHAQTPGGEYELLDLTDALSRMEEMFPRQTQVIELRYFAGLSVEEAGEVLGVSPRTVKTDTRLALTWLRREIGGPVA